ncbi:MAG: sugar phosphorylase [Candidatus Brocadiia bacterium]
MTRDTDELIWKRLERRIEKLYNERDARSLKRILPGLVARYKTEIPERRSGWDQRDSVLITYADSILEDGTEPLETLYAFLQDRVGKTINIVHLLPFFPYSSDDGFAVTDYRKVRENLGSWDDVENLSKDYRLVFDAVINHISASSIYAERFCEGDPEYRNFFIRLEAETDTSSVLRTRDEPLLHKYDTTRGEEWLWTTFSRDQIDLNFAEPRVLIEILDVLMFYAKKGASILRLDAVPYLWKELGTSCAHLPQTHELIKLMREVFDLAAPHVLLLAEANVPHERNVTYVGGGGDESQIIYNFTMPPLVLHALVKGNARHLSEWADGLEDLGENATYLNITATHDGIGMRPTEGLLSEEERRELVQLAYDHHGDVTGKRNSDGTISPYELNLNYFDAVNHPDADESLERQIDRFMVSQAIPLCFRGMPGIYVQSLLGSRNDLEAVEKTGRARSINREKLDRGILEAELDRPDSPRHRVFGRYMHLLELRQRESAFHPDAEQDVLDFGPEIFAVRRHNTETDETILALHNVTEREQQFEMGQGGRDIITEETLRNSRGYLSAYQIRWVKVVP